MRLIEEVCQYMYETIKHILCQNQLLMTDLPFPSKDEVIKYENEIKTPIPNWYKYFVELNGLNDLRFNFEMLHPRELNLNQKYISHNDFHVFATNGCGDVYCWSIHKPNEIHLWDHEINEIKLVDTDIINGLKQNRI